LYRAGHYGAAVSAQPVWRHWYGRDHYSTGTIWC